MTSSPEVTRTSAADVQAALEKLKSWTPYGVLSEDQQALDTVLAYARERSAVEATHPDGVEVTARDLKTGEEGKQVMMDDYLLIVAGSHYLANTNKIQSTGTIQLTIKKST